MATLQFQGVGSGLDVDGLVARLMAIERRPLELLAQKETGYKSQLSAYGTMKGALATLQSAANGLSLQKFRGAKASVGDATLLSASATSSSAAGSYTVEVEQLAQAQKLKTGVLTSVGTGSLTIDFGTYSGGAFALNPDKASKTIAITQDSLAGARDAINAAGAGVRASIINDGTGNRLVIASTDSGAANALRITVDDADGNDADAAGLSQLAYDASTGGVAQMAETVLAQDARAVIDGIVVTSASNSLSGAIEGVSLDLLKAVPGTETTLTVARDIEGAKAAVDAFVKAYNDASKVLKSLSAYDAATKVAGPLQGDSTVVGAQSRMRAVLGAAVEQAGSYATLSSLGVSFQKDGTLLADAGKLRAALASDDAAAVFAAIGKPSDSLVSYSSAVATAEPGAYAINVTQLATRGRAAGSVAAALTITAGVNDTLQLSVDGAVKNVTLAAGNYTATTLAAMLQSRIEGVEATEAGGVLTLTSNSWGSTSAIAITGGSAAADLFGAASSTAGVNAAGSIGGVAASGSGRNLTGKGLTVSIDGGATGARGTLTFSRGVADRLAVAIDSLLGSSLAARTDGIAVSLKGLDTRRETLNARLEGVEQRLRRQFAALDNMMASMNSTSSFLTQQLASLPKIGSGQ